MSRGFNLKYKTFQEWRKFMKIKPAKKRRSVDVDDPVEPFDETQRVRVN